MIELQTQYKWFRIYAKLIFIIALVSLIFLIYNQLYIYSLFLLLFMIGVSTFLGKYIAGVYLSLLLLKDIRQKGGEVSFDELLNEYIKKGSSSQKDNETTETVFRELIERLKNHDLIKVHNNIIKTKLK